jgi:hypothetical protein
MKNVYLIPTDKPSRLCIDNSCNELNYSEIEGLSSKHITNQCMYITSDEVIKEGDWVVTPNKTIMLVTTKYTTESSFMIGNSKHKGSPYYIEFCRKIILTTDQDLIKDGVQKIDDEFLEWFVKNPTCENIPIITTTVSKESTYKTNIGFESWRKEEPSQDKRMYSEKELFQIIAEILHTPALRDGSWEDIGEWFEQFKKK